MRSRRIGVWVDHRRAVIVVFEKGPPRVLEVESTVEPRVRMTGGSRGREAYFHQGVAPEKHRDEKIRHQITAYLTRVIDQIGSADEMLIMGPGQARTELAGLAQERGLGGSTGVLVEAADKMTRRQIVARVRAHFKPRRRRRPGAAWRIESP